MYGDRGDLSLARICYCINRWPELPSTRGCKWLKASTVKWTEFGLNLRFITPSYETLGKLLNLSELPFPPL